jgi:UDP-glucuronate 4-epimerase
MAFIETIEKKLGRTAKKNMLPMQPGDVPATFADVRLMQALTDFRPTTTVEEGVGAFVDWYLDYTKSA